MIKPAFPAAHGCPGISNLRAEVEMDDVLQPIRRQVRPTWYPELEPLRFEDGEVEILGVVSGVVRTG